MGLGLCPAMGGALSCTGLVFFSKQSPNGWDIVLWWVDTLSRNEWIYSSSSLLMGGALSCNGLGHCLVLDCKTMPHPSPKQCPTPNKAVPHPLQHSVPPIRRLFKKKKSNPLQDHAPTQKHHSSVPHQTRQCPTHYNKVPHSLGDRLKKEIQSITRPCLIHR